MWRYRKRKLSLTIIVMMIMAMLPTMALAASPSDISNHWAKAYIEDWIDQGLVNGYPDGTFKPDNNITRAEFMVLVNGAFGYTGKASKDYNDVAATDWYADAVAIATNAGYITGYADGTVKPNNQISRQEVAVVIMKVNNLTQNESAADKFADAVNIAAWSKGAIGATVAAGIMNGYPDGSFKAANFMSKAEAVVALSKALGSVTGVTPITPVDGSEIYDKAGTYGPVSGSQTVEGDVTIKASGVTLQNTLIKGDLIIDKGVGKGEATFKNVIVKGNTYIKGGGVNSIYFIDSETGKTYVLKDDGPVRIVVSGTSEINQLIAQSGVVVEEVDLTGDGIEGIIVDKKVDGNIEINLINVNVDNLTIKSEGVTVKTDKNTNINTFVADAKASVTGKVTIENAIINASGVSLETKPENQTVATGVSQPSITGTSSGGGGGGSSSVAVSAISVEGKDKATTITTKNGTLQMVATVTPSNASNKAVTWDFVDDNDDTGYASIDTNTGLLTAKGDGTVTVRATSVSTPSVSGTAVITISGQEEVVEPEVITGSLESTNNIGIAPDTAGDAAGKIYAEYKMVAGEEDISLAKDNVEYIKVKVGEGEWKDLTANTDATLWFNVEAETGLRTFEVKTTDGNIYTATLDWDKAIKTATWEATNREGDHEGVTYVEYKLMDTTNPISLKIGEVKLIASKDDGKWVALEPNTDATLWFNKAKATGNYEFFVVTKDGVMYKATLAYTAPGEEPDVIQGTWKVTGDTGFNTVEGTAYVFQEFELLVDSKRVSLHQDNAKSITVDDKELTPNTDETLWFNVLKATGDYKFVVVDNDDVTYEATLSWTAPTEVTATAEGDPAYNSDRGATYQKYNVADISLTEFAAMYQIKPVSGNISKLTPSGDDCLWFKVGADEEGWEQEEGDHIFLVKHGETWSKFVVNYKAEEEPVVPEVYGSMTAYGSGNVVEENGTYTATFGGEIPWYDADTSVGRNEAGNRVGVKIFMPEDEGYNPAGIVEIKIGDNTYNWEDIKDGEDHFQWWPLVTEKGQEFTATIKWNSASEQTFKIEIADDATLEEAPVEEVSGSITRGDNTGGADLVWNTDEKDTVIFTEGEIKWYEADPSVGRDVDGNWVGVKITAPEGFTAEDLKDVKVQIGDNTYDWSEIQDGEFYFLWYPLITVDKKEYTATVERNTASSQTFKVVIGENVTLEAAPVELIAATVDYQAVWNETRGTWYIKVTVPDENLDADSVRSIYVIKEAGEELAEPKALTPDTDTMMWFGVAGADGLVDNKAAGEYAYKVVRQDDSEYIFNFTYAPESVTGVINFVAAALDKVNIAEITDRVAAYNLVMEVAETLGLNVGEGSDFAGLVQGRAEAAAKDLLDNRGDGYELGTIQGAFDEIVETRLEFEKSVALFAGATTEQPLANLDYITMLVTNLEAVEYQTIHSGRSINDDILPELNKLVEDFNALTPEQQETVLKDMNYSATTSSTATRNALRAAIDQVLADEKAAIDAALGQVNTAEITDRVAAYDLVMEVAETLGLNVGEGSDFAGLVQGRAEAAAKDLLDNRGDGYELGTIQGAFDEIVETRLEFEKSVALFAGATTEQPLANLDYITMLVTNLEAVEYQTIHSGRSINDDILPELNKLVEDFGKLTEQQQTTVLKDMNYSATTSSTATRNALRAAITKVLADGEA